MKFTRTSPVFFPLIIFLFFFIITVSGYFVLHKAEPADNFLADHIFYYVINVFTWLSGAFLLNAFINIFVWGGLGKPKSSGVDTILVDLVSAFVYTLAFLGILTILLEQKLDLGWISILVIFLVVFTFIRRKILSLFKGTFFSTESPYSIGDWIELKGESNVIGEVIDVSRRSTKLKTEDGTIAVIPNQIILDEIIINYSGTKEEVKISFDLTLDFSVETDRVKRIIYAGVKDTTYFSTLKLTKDVDILVSGTNDLGIIYTIGVWVIPWKELTPNEIKDLFYSSILKHLSFAGISLAYPKNDVYYSKMPVRVNELTTTADIKNVLCKNQLLLNFSDDELIKIAEKVSLSNYMKGELLIKQDNDGDSMFILIEGIVEVITKNEKGTEIVLGTVSPGQYFGEMSLLTGDPRSASVRAVTDTTLYEIKKDYIENILTERPELVELLSKTIAERRESNVQKIEEASHTKDSLYREVLGKIKNFFKI